MASQLSFLLIPLMPPGHIIPIIDMAKLLAKHGVNTTIIVTPLDAKRFGPVIDRAAVSGLPIRLLQIRFPCEEAGLPEGCESADSLPSYNLIRNFSTAINLLQPILEEALQELNPTPSCIISDKHIPWTADTCKKFDIPRITFDGMNCFTQLVTKCLHDSRVHESVPANEKFVVPGLPDRIEFTKFQLPGYFNPGSTHVSGFREEVRRTESLAYGVVVNSFEELEKRYVDEFRKAKGGKVWCIGPLSLCSNDRAETGNHGSIGTDDCLAWLDKREPGSVIYACLGSLSRLTLDQFVELALGLELSNSPFILVINRGSNLEEIENWVSENGFEERTNERGLLIRGWAPQVVILSNCSVGGFLTHCGWNSTLESVSAGLPMVTWPLFAEQFLNEKLVLKVLDIGVGVGAKSVVHLGEKEKDENKVSRKRIMAAVERVMDKGKEGCERRERARELGEIAKKSVEAGRSSDYNVKIFIQDIAQLVKKYEVVQWITTLDGY